MLYAAPKRLREGIHVQGMICKFLVLILGSGNKGPQRIEVDTSCRVEYFNERRCKHTNNISS